jgi:hypothetical protein
VRTVSQYVLCALVSLLYYLEGGPAYAQGTFRADLSGLSPGQVLSEQFASSGIHFITAGSANPPLTVRAAEFLSKKGETVGIASIFIVRFDEPVRSFAFDIAQARDPNLPLNAPNWRIYPLHAAGEQVAGDTGGSFPAGEWHRATVTYADSLQVRQLQIEGWQSRGENFLTPIYFDNLEAAVVPEPGFCSLLITGAAAFVGLRLCRSKDPLCDP